MRPVDIINRNRHAELIPAEELRQEFEEEYLALPPTTAEALAAAFEVIGNELVRRKMLARRADDKANAERLMAGMWALSLVDGALDEDILRNDFLRHVEDVREALATLPPFNPDEDDAWIER